MRQSVIPNVIQSGNVEHYTCAQHFGEGRENVEFNKMWSLI